MKFSMPKSYLKSFIRNTSIVHKVIVITVSLVIIPLIITGIIYYVNVRLMVENEVRSTYEQMADQYIEGINYKINIYVNLLTAISNSDSVQDLLSNAYNGDLYLDIETDQKIGRTIDSLTLSNNYNEIKKITVFVLNGSNGIQGKYVNSLENIDPKTWMDRINLRQRRLQYVNYENDKNLISFVKPISSIRAKNRLELLGAAKLDIDKTKIFQVVDQKIGGIGKLILFVNNSSGELIYSNHKEGDTESGKSLEGQSIVLERIIDFRDWKVRLIFPVQTIENKIVNTILLVSVSIGILGAMSIILILAFSKSFSRRLSLLLGKMDKVKKGNMDIEYCIEGEDEIGIADKNFNEMVFKLKESINENYLQKLAKREAEIKALHFQINPHFLYNTLECINSMALVHQHREISNIVSKLGDMLRYNLNTDMDETVLLREELWQVQNYIDIQKIRFGNNFVIFMDVPEDLMECRVLKFILQPLVENVVQHGFQKQRDKFYAEITASVKEGIMEILVIDEGAGIPKEKVAHINDILKDGKQDAGVGQKRSIGLQNVNSRIRLKYGEQYGIEIDSVENVRTAVIVRFPIESEVCECTRL